MVCVAIRVPHQRDSRIGRKLQIADKSRSGSRGTLPAISNLQNNLTCKLKPVADSRGGPITGRTPADDRPTTSPGKINYRPASFYPCEDLLVQKYVYVVSAY